MRFAICSALVCSFLSVSSFGEPSSDSSHVLISIGSDAVVKLQQQFRNHIEVLKKTNDLALIRIPAQDLPYLSEFMHTAFNRCGGFIVEKDDLQEAINDIEEDNPSIFVRPKIKNQKLVNKVIPNVEEKSIRSTIETMSAFRNRLYTSETGVRSQEWVGSKWKEIAAIYPNAELQYVKHKDYPQRSVILTIKGTKKPDEIIVIGGHGDSIAGWRRNNDVIAPGADDNASGIATITEVLRVLAKTRFKPERTIKFMSYAAEEVGLRGSQDIAESFKASRQNVVGVIQLDMTNFSTRMEEIVIMTDFTNNDQNAFLKELIQTYLPSMVIQEDVCGYACSDHASWTRNGFPASIPFESRMSEYNPHIHTAKDTLAASHNKAEHAVPYAKLVLSYIMEMQ